MKLVDVALDKRSLMTLFIFLLAFAGVKCYLGLGRLEYPNFTIKQAMVITAYPGASPREVEEEVTDVIEEAIQKLSQLDYVKSTSQEGLSFITLEIKPHFKGAELPQIWDELRRKVNDVQGSLPAGAGPSQVFDDFGDVYGVFLSLSGEGYSVDELKDYADELKKQLLLVGDVAKIDFFGVQSKAIYVEFKRAQMAKLGVSPQQIFSTLSAQNLVEQSGKVRVGDEYIRLSPAGDISTEDAIRDLHVSSSSGNLVRIGDVAEVKRGHSDPPDSLLRYNGQPAIGIGVSTVAGGNVVRMGEAIKKKLEELKSSRPLGMRIDYINYQSDGVTKTLDLFIENLVEAVLIVIGMLLLFMGFRSGVIIGGTLLLIILGSFVGMQMMSIDLQLISLGALIIALGMLVDNAIVVVDVLMIKLERGVDRLRACLDAVKETEWPLLGATVVGVLAFMPVGFNPGNSGDFCRSLFWVIAISLLLSWLLAVTITPLLCFWFLKAPAKIEKDPFDKKFYHIYRGFLHLCIVRKKTVFLVLVALLVLAKIGFSFVPDAFFMNSTREQFYIDFWRCQSSHIEDTAADVAKVEEYVRSMPGVVSTSSFIGAGALRFVLSYNYHTPNPSYAQILVKVKDYKAIDAMIPKIYDHLRRNYPNAEPRVMKFTEGPPVEYSVEARFRGPDPAVLRELADKAKEIIAKEPMAFNARDNWRTPVKTFKVEYSEAKARKTGVTRDELSQSLQWSFNGLREGVFREANELVPIMARLPENERVSADNLEKVQVWNSVAGSFLPLMQVADKISTQWEQPLRHRRCRMPTITVQADATKEASALLGKVRPQIEALPLPPGYALEWGGEFEESAKGQKGLQTLFPIAIVLMFLIVCLLFKTLREPAIIYLCLPFAIIGVAAGLLVFRLPFGFMAILGFLGLTGMLIRNAVVLLDQINKDLEAGEPPYKAVLDASVSRLRPVCMAAGATIVGMAPLVVHPFFCGMAATIMCGLFVATALTLVLVPILYTIFFKVVPDDEYAAGAKKE